MELVAQWDAATLISIIQHHVHPGTVIWSDMSAAYDGVQHLPSVAQAQIPIVSVSQGLVHLL